MADAINIVLFEKGPKAEFVEIETDDGASVSIGERIEQDGYAKIRITPDDITALCDATQPCKHDWQHYPMKPGGFTVCNKCGVRR